MCSQKVLRLGGSAGRCSYNPRTVRFSRKKSHEQYAERSTCTKHHHCRAGAQVVAVDLSPDARALAGRLGAAATVDAAVVADTAAEIRTLTDGGAHISLDCVGSPATCASSIACLRKRGRSNAT